MKINLYQYKNKYCLAAVVFLIVPLSGVNIDIYVPSLPAVSNYFHATKSFSQYSITTYLIGLGVMQLFAGSFSDSFGRKKPFLIAMMMYIMTTFLIPCSQTIYQLIFLRFFQGTFLALAVVPMRSVITDLFEGKELQKMITYMTIAWSLGPIIAPAIGGCLQYYLGWKANFYFLGIYSFITFILGCIFLFETSAHQYPFQIRNALNCYQNMLLNQEYFNCIAIGGLLFSIITLFGIVGPFFIQIILHYTATQFGYLTLLLGLAWFLGAMTNRFILHVTLAKKSIFCLSLMLIISLLMSAVTIFYPMIIYNIIIPMFLLFFLSGMLYPSYFIHSVLLFSKTSASANALYNSSAFFIAGIFSGFGSLIKLNTELPFICALIVLISLCLIFYYLNLYSKRNYILPTLQKEI